MPTSREKCLLDSKIHLCWNTKPCEEQFCNKETDSETHKELVSIMKVIQSALQLLIPRIFISIPVLVSWMQQRDTKLQLSRGAPYQVRFMKEFSTEAVAWKNRNLNHRRSTWREHTSFGNTAKFNQLVDFNIETYPHERQRYQQHWNRRENKKYFKNSFGSAVVLGEFIDYRFEHYQQLLPAPFCLSL